MAVKEIEVDQKNLAWWDLFWLLREFGFRNLEIVDHFDKYLLLKEEPVQWIAKSVLVYKSVNLTLPNDCLMRPDFGGILKSVSLLIGKCLVWLPAGQWMFLFINTTRMIQGPTQPLIQWVLSVRPGREVEYWRPSSVDVKTVVRSWCAQGQL